ncbi:MAG: cobalamin biosynthesis protein [Lachnospiraceae bacterium]
MQIELISFTQQGRIQAEKIKELLKQELDLNMESKSDIKQNSKLTLEKNLTQHIEDIISCTDARAKEISLSDWCEYGFAHASLLIMVGAMGIAVRGIAPFVKDKFTDPPVLVVDEKGTFVIPILSGHMGGANQWAVTLAELLTAIPVITTATDLNKAFAVDVFAAKNKLCMQSREWAKEISAAVLRGEEIEFVCESTVQGVIPEKLVKEPRSHSISIGIHTGCNLYPKAVSVGIGCKKGKTMAELEEVIKKNLEKHGIAMESILCFSSVTQKKEEPGILACAKQYKIPFYTFSPQQLKETPGEYEDSTFVEQTIGIGNVCERGAVKGLQEHAPWEQIHVIQKKTAENGITIAIAVKEWSVRFE